MSLAAILALVNSVVSAFATMARSIIELIPWSNPIVWVVLSFVGGCEYGRTNVIQQVNEQRKHEERPAIIHPFRPWLGVSEAEGGEIQPSEQANPIEPIIDDNDYIEPEQQKIEQVSLATPVCGPKGCGPCTVRQPVRKILKRLFRW